jgi:hypothetical protein
MIVLDSLSTYLYEFPYVTLGSACAVVGCLTTWQRGQTTWGGGAMATLTLDAPLGRNPQ